MPINFSLLPTFIGENIAKKMKFTAMFMFNNSSPLATFVISGARLTLPMEIEEVNFCFYEENLQVRFDSAVVEFEDYIPASFVPSIPFEGLKIVVNGTFTEAFCNSLLSFFLEKGARGNTLVLQSSCETMENCSPDVIMALLKAADATELTSGCPIPPAVLKNLPEKISKVKVDSPVEDGDLSEIRRAKLDISDSKVGNIGLNNLLREWSNGIREIDSLYISTENRLSIPQILNGINHQRTEDDRRFILNNGHQLLHCVIGENGYLHVATDVDKL